jgi:hypothetical protein
MNPFEKMVPERRYTFPVPPPGSETGLQKTRNGSKNHPFGFGGRPQLTPAGVVYDTFKSTF